jgi:hypothetical protein
MIMECTINYAEITQNPVKIAGNHEEGLRVQEIPLRTGLLDHRGMELFWGRE